MGGPALTLQTNAAERGPVATYFVTCDGHPVTAPAPWPEASAALRELRAARAFAAETLRHVLSNPKTEA
jgi:hypothetical protein